MMATSPQRRPSAINCKPALPPHSTGGVSGSCNGIGTALAEVYAKQFDVNSKIQTTGASVENINPINQKKAEMALVMSDVLGDAVNGSNSFPQKIDTVVQVATLLLNHVQVVTSSNSGIKTSAVRQSPQNSCTSPHL